MPTPKFDIFAGMLVEKQSTQVTSMPTASASNEGNIVQYKGETTSDYVNGYFYKCIENEDYVPANVTVTQTAGLTMGSFTVDQDKFIAKVNNTAGTYRYEFKGYPSVITVTDNSTSTTLTFNRYSAIDGSGYYGWATNDNVVVFTTTKTPTASSTFYTVGSGTAPVVADYTYVSTTTRDTSRMLNGYWSVKDAEAEIPNFQEDYGIGNDQAAFIGVQISVVYTLATGNECNWTRINVQPSVSGTGIAYTDLHASSPLTYNNTNGTYGVETATASSLGVSKAIQVTTMPTASSTYLNQVVQFIGDTTTDYEQGLFYICELQGSTYSWNYLPTDLIASTTDFGLVKPDGTTITINNGIISSTGGGSGANLYTLEGLSITSSNTDIRTLLQAVDAKNLPIGSIITGAVDLTDAPADNISNSNIHIESYKFTEGSTTNTIYRATLTSQGAAPYQWFIEYWNTHPQGSMTWVEAPLAFYSMPTASSKYVNMIAQFVGSDDGIHVQGKFYLCQEVTPVTDPPTYEWVLIHVEPVGSSSDFGIVKVDNSSIVANSGVISANKATGNYSVSFVGNPATTTSALNIGANSTAHGWYATALGCDAVVGDSANDVRTAGAIQLGRGSNTEAGTMYVGLSTNGSTWNNYKLLESDGKIPSDRMLGTASITDGSTLTLANNYVYSNSTAIASLTIAYPTTYTSAFCAEVNFVSGSTATTLILPASIIMKGDDVSSSVFTPVANASYSVMFSSIDGNNKVGIVMKIA